MLFDPECNDRDFGRAEPCGGPLDDLLTAYTTLERRVQRQMERQCAPFCTSCTAACCRPEFCRESMESPFLSLLVAQNPPKRPWCADTGWLGDRGCTLSTGRPPVCYSFFCGAIGEGQATPLHLYSLSVLSSLMAYTGRNAKAGRHLVESTDLGKLNFIRLMRQYREASAIADHLALFWQDSDRHPLLLDLCRKVCRPVGLSNIAR